MVYRSLGIVETQQDIWPRVACLAWDGRRKARTRLLCQDALAHNLEAMIVQARQPWPLLQRCTNAGWRVILHHQPRVGAGEGHYSVLLDMTELEIVVHDPQAGPERHWQRDDFLAAWGPGGVEVPGYVLVVITASSPSQLSCPVCGQGGADTVSCCNCRQTVQLRPEGTLGCLRPDCAGRLWERVFCPTCDWGMTSVT
jgi:hypothetical protein